MSQEEISNQYKNLVTPSSFTFPIWDIVYSLVLVFLIYQLYLNWKDKYDSNFHKKLNGLFFLSCLLNIG